MRRLREIVSSQDPDEAFVGRLVASSRPYEAAQSDDVKQRVRSALDARPVVPPRSRWIAGITFAVLCVAVLVLRGHEKPIPTPAANRVSTTTEAILAPSEAKAPTEPSVMYVPPKRRMPHTRARVPTPAHDDRESELVVEAIARWRNDHDREGAYGLVALYLERYPDGALVEEAYSLAIETTERDPAHAAQLANRYLQRFPDGRFAEQARGVLNDQRR